MTAKYNFNGRLANLIEKIDSEELDALLITKSANVAYFSGFHGDSTALFVGKNFKNLITDGRYTEQARQQSKNFSIIEQTEGLYKKIVDIIKNSGVRKIGVEGLVMTVAEHAYLQKELPKIDFKSLEVDSLRQIKDEAEIFNIKHACNIADRAFAKILPEIKPGVREIDIAADLEYFMRRFGSEKAAFTTIVASGWRSSLPHGIATDKKICAGDFVTLDFGATWRGYHSDITRTVFVGKASPEQRKIYNIVLDAQIFGLEVISAGKSGKNIDSAVRERLNASGYGKFFVHGLGHGVGLEIHEEPRLSKLSKCENLFPNMIVTDEPGIYIENFGGVRIEDTVLVSAEKSESLTLSPKNLIEL